MQTEALYFIALVADDKIKDQVRKLKEEIRDVYGARHALKSPAHITLQMPFKRASGEEASIIRELKSFASQQSPFHVVLSGFGSFKPRVLFIKVVDPEPIIKLHASLKEVLAGRLGFGEGEMMKDVQPHMTIATRDLDRDMFRRAWPLFEDREFEGSFRAESIALLKHNGRSWDVFCEFTLGKNG